jgi:enediyne biosynthesis protein E4
MAAWRAGLAGSAAAAAAGSEAAAFHRYRFLSPNFAYRTDNNFTGRKYFPQTMCGGVAAFDFDNDGRMDLFFTNGAKLPELEKTDPRFYNCLLRNRGDGTFEDVTARAGLLGKDLGIQLRRGRRRLRQRRL